MWCVRIFHKFLTSAGFLPVCLLTDIKVAGLRILFPHVWLSSRNLFPKDLCTVYENQLCMVDPADSEMSVGTLSAKSTPSPKQIMILWLRIVGSERVHKKYLLS